MTGSTPPPSPDDDAAHPDPATIICDVCSQPYGSFISDPFTGRMCHRQCVSATERPPGQPVMAATRERDAHRLAELVSGHRPAPPPLR
jgi:hypothetical protein